MSTVEFLANHGRLMIAVAGFTAAFAAGLALWVHLLLRGAGRGQRD